MRILGARGRRLHRQWLVVLCAALVLLGMHCSHFLYPRERIIVVGAGLAGLAAARALQECCDVVVLEARDRLGGRVWTDHSLGVPVELGAVWIHRATHNVLTELADAHGCRHIASENKRLALYGVGGERLPEDLVARAYTALTRRLMPEFLRRRDALRQAGRDQDMASLMGGVPEVRALLAGADARGRCALDFLLFRDIVQDHTAELQQASAAQYDMDAYGGNGRDEVVPAGLDCLVSRLGAGLDVRLGRAVTAVAALQGGGVRVRVAGGAAMLADRVIVTVPLGVLKAAGGKGGGGGGGGGAGHEGRGGVAFDPAPPRALEDAIARLGFGEAIKVALRFPSVFWPRDAHFLGKVGGGCSELGGGGARHIEFVNVAAYTGGAVLLLETEQQTARWLAAMTDELLLEAVMGELRLMFPHAPSPVGWIIARLGNETFQRGAFAYVPPFIDEPLQRVLHRPWADGRIMLAGEHTSWLHMGTMHGALVSGRQAAEHVRAAQQGRGEDATSWWHTSYTDRYVQRLRSVLESDGESPEDGDGEYTWDRNP